MGNKSSKYNKYIKNLIKDKNELDYSINVEGVQQQRYTCILPIDNVKLIIDNVINGIFPSNDYSKISRVCKTWCKLAIKNIKGIDYNFPYIYDTNRCIMGCKVISRWLTKINHFQIENRVECVSLRFGFDPFGFCLLTDRLIQLDSLKSLTVQFYGKNLTNHKLESIFNICSKNKSIRKLDISENSFSTPLSNIVSMTFQSQKLQNLREFHMSSCKINSQQFQIILRGCLSSSSLLAINFSRNQIDGEEIEETISLLQSSKYLKFIDLSMNLFSAKNIQSIISTCIKNKAVRKLKIKQSVKYSNQAITHQEIQSLRIDLQYKLNPSNNIKIYI